MKPTKDLFSGHAGDYMRYRPGYPEALFNEILALTSRHELAWDAGTGNGQVAVALRCGLLRGDTAHLQAGAGIVADSDPEAEYQETLAKVGSLMGYLEQLEIGPGGKGSG